MKTYIYLVLIIIYEVMIYFMFWLPDDITEASGYSIHIGYIKNLACTNRGNHDLKQFLQIELYKGKDISFYLRTTPRHYFCEDFFKQIPHPKGLYFEGHFSGSNLIQLIIGDKELQSLEVGKRYLNNWALLFMSVPLIYAFLSYANGIRNRRKLKE